MFYKIYTFLLIFVCRHFFEEVFGNILLIDPEKVILDNNKKNEFGHHTVSMWITEKDFSSLSKEEIIVNNKYGPYYYCYDAMGITETYYLKTSKKYVVCGPLILDIENKNEIFAELYVNFYAYIYENIKKKDTIYIKITFEEKHIILNYNGKDNIFEYNEEINQKLDSFMWEINKRSIIEIIKIQTSKLDNNISLINDTVYAKHTRIQLRNLENLSLWKYVKEELVQSYFPTLPNTAINDFILNSTMHRIDIKFTLKKAIKIMCDRIFKFAILLMVYAYEALRIDYCKTLYWDQFINNFKKLGDALYLLDGDEKLRIGLDKINEGLNNDIKYAFNGCATMCVFQKLVNNYAEYFFTPQEIENLKKNFRCNNIKNDHILSQNGLDKIFKGFSKPHGDNETYKFKLICEKELEEKFQHIFMLIDVEFERINIIDL
ncbi:uncharacterized protein LOC126909123 isoform X2 [Daktulosphaira vitifoliae]|uniref:uncharacterized protein LOC126909123 isoform X2 n=1 Tax=Daktulosphaira vitifoliae TaxID=58002 RepID=UPI0021AAD6DC|nr:uncharacterized protein LOC126909123 isoform X2 [Daktulosphaira vitifoliae]